MFVSGFISLLQRLFLFKWVAWFQPYSQSEDQRPLSDVATNKRSSPRAFAVIIGINKYIKEPYRGLKSAVSDADRFESWLISELGLPSENITSLRNESATGQGIRAALHGILDNQDSDANNITIIFYFAGHVSTANAQRDRRASEDEAQMLLPYDFDANLSNNFEGSWTQPGCGIMQVELGNTMESLSQKKPGLGF
ncbi:hypothetical protein H0H93_008166, partial [Arthromyces matolae]